MKKVNLFILFSTISSSFTTVFLPFILLKKGYTVKQILLFFILIYFYSILNLLVIKQIKNIRIYYFYPFLFLLFIIFLYKINNYFIYSLCAYFYSLYLSLYFVLRNIISIKNVKYKDKTKVYIIFNLIGLIFGTLIGYFNVFSNEFLIILFSFLFLFLSSLIITKNYSFSYFKLHKIKKNLVIFLFFEQFKYIIITFSSLYIFLNISTKIKYIVLVYIFSYLSSIILLLIKKINLLNYKFIITCLCILFIIKFNTTNKTFLLAIVFLESIFRYLYENLIFKKIYQDCYKKCVVDYSVIVEFIKNIFRFIILFIFYILNINMYYVLIISCIILFFSVFIKFDSV